jgi:beta-glucanase (GH16 family)
MITRRDLITVAAGVVATVIAIGLEHRMTTESVYLGTEIPVPASMVNVSGTDQSILPDPAVAYTFQDEFFGPAGSAPDTAKWGYDLGAGGWGNNELETYTSTRANSYLDGQGHLVISATTDGKGGYMSARMNTNGKFQQQGGHFEARIQLDSQPGLWPAFWLLGSNIGSSGWPMCGEVDIMEDYGQGFTETTVHTPNGSSATYTQHSDVILDNNWHTYRLDWDLQAEVFTFSRDGSPYFTASAEEFPSQSWVFGPQAPNNGGMFFMLNMAVGGFVGAPPAATKFPAVMLVDYVRAWH